MIAPYLAELRAPFLPLSVGSTDAGVKRVQEWLTLNGFATGIDGDFGPATRAAVEAFQRSAGCARDDNAGVVDVETWGALIAPLHRAEIVSSMPDKFGERVSRIARAHLAVRAREVGGDNRGPWVRHYGRGVDQSTVEFFPWCQAFASHVWLKAARELESEPPFALVSNGGPSFWVPWVVEQAKAAGKFKAGVAAGAVPVGSMFFVPGQINSRPAHIHVGLVIEDGPDTVTTIEGNTNHDGSANGYEVAMRYRRKTNIDFGFI